MVRSLNGMRKPLESRPWVRRALMRDLALQTDTQVKLAKKYGVSRDGIKDFKARHLDEIREIAARAEDEFAGIALTVKANRLAMYQDQVEKAEDRGDWKLVARLLRQMAEEMGHLPSRMQISGAVDVHTSYSIIGEDGVPVDIARLK